MECLGLWFKYLGTKKVWISIVEISNHGTFHCKSIIYIYIYVEYMHIRLKRNMIV